VAAATPPEAIGAKGDGAPAVGGLGRVLGNLGAGGIEGLLGGGLSELVDKFKKAGHGKAADSWAGTGENKPIARPQLQQALGADLLAGLSEKSGFSSEELRSRISITVPTRWIKYTPAGRLP
jgi:uncharacterized protein YidB (DUF937 family)